MRPGSASAVPLPMAADHHDAVTSNGWPCREIRRHRPTAGSWGGMPSAAATSSGGGISPAWMIRWVPPAWVHASEAPPFCGCRYGSELQVHITRTSSALVALQLTSNTRVLPAGADSTPGYRGNALHYIDNTTMVVSGCTDRWREAGNEDQRGGPALPQSFWYSAPGAQRPDDKTARHERGMPDDQARESGRDARRRPRHDAGRDRGRTGTDRRAAGQGRRPRRQVPQPPPVRSHCCGW